MPLGVPGKSPLTNLAEGLEKHIFYFFGGSIFDQIHF